MGYMRHHAIVVTSYQENAIKAAREKAIELLRAQDSEIDRTNADRLVSPIIDGTRNGYSSFLIAPDGSKEWWDESDRIAAAREAWIQWARGFDGPLDWVLVQFGDDERETKIDDAHQAAKVMDDSDADAEDDDSAFGLPAGGP